MEMQHRKNLMYFPMRYCAVFGEKLSKTMDLAERLKHWMDGIPESFKVLHIRTSNMIPTAVKYHSGQENPWKTSGNCDV
jgi:hypothetical protein